MMKKAYRSFPYPLNAVMRIADAAASRRDQGPKPEDVEAAASHFEENIAYAVEKNVLTEQDAKAFADFFKGMSTKEIAEKAGTSRQNVVEKINRAVERLSSPYGRQYVFAGKEILSKLLTTREEYERALSEADRAAAEVRESGRKAGEADPEGESESPAVDDVGFSTLTRNSLRRAGIYTIEGLRRFLAANGWDDRCLTKIRNIGKKGSAEIMAKLREMGIAQAADPVHRIKRMTLADLVGVGAVQSAIVKEKRK